MSSFLGAIISEPTALIISELTGPRNTLELRGRALPYRPLAFEGGMRANFSWYPGNPVATVQMLGADEKSTTINGMWKDKYIRSTNDIGLPVLTGRTGVATLNGRQVADVRSLVRVWDGFRLRGQLLELRWDEKIRQGILLRFRDTWLRREDVEWEAEFGWISRGEPVTPIAFSPSIPNIDISNQINDAIEGLRNVAVSPFALVTNISGEITNILEVMSSAGAALNDIAGKATQAILSPLDAARSTLAAIQTVKDQATAMRDLMETVPARAMRQAASIETLASRIVAGGTLSVTETTVQTEGGEATTVGVSVIGATQALKTTSRTQTSGIASITHEEAIEAEAYKRSVVDGSRSVRNTAAIRELELEAQTIRVPNVTAFAVADDDDLRDVATRFYGSPEEWKCLLTYNNLSTSKLTAGQVLLVPPLNVPT